MKTQQHLPTVIQFPVNDICNSKCQMCNIWQQKLDFQITAADLDRILEDPVFCQVEHVGINGGEPTLRDDLDAITHVLANRLPALKELHLITNALASQKVMKRIRSMGKVCRGSGIDLNVMVSLDGIGDVHDRVRGREGNFVSACEVLDFLQGFDDVSRVLAGCTVIKENVFDCENVLDWCMDRDLYVRFRVGIPHQRLYSLEFDHPSKFSADQLFHFANFLDNLRLHYETSRARQQFYLSLRNQLVYGAPRSAGCAWKSQGVTLTSRGDLAFCAVESPSLGNLISGQQSASELYWNNTPILQQIVSERCSSCLHDYSGPAVPVPAWKKYARDIVHGTMSSLARVVRLAVPPAVRRTVSGGLQRLRRQRRLKNLGVSSISSLKKVPDRTHQLPRRVLICGWYGTETLGDKAILAGMVSRLEELDLEIHLASLEEYVSTYTIHQMPDLKITKQVALTKAAQRVIDGDYRAVIMGGGPLMSPIPEVHLIRDLFAEIRKVGGKAIIAGAGVGPLGVKKTNRAIGELVQLANAMFFRDRLSASLARSLGQLDSEPLHSMDPAILWTTEQCRAPEIQRKDQILLGLRDWPISEYGSGFSAAEAKTIKQSFEEEVIRFVEGVQAHSPNTRIIPFCMHKYAVGGNDRLFYRRLLKRFPRVIAELDHRHRSPAADFLLFRESRATLAMRFHSVLFSVSAKTPFRAIDYTHGGKVAALLSELGLASRLSKMDARGFDGFHTARDLLDETRDLLPLDIDTSEFVHRCRSQLDFVFEGLI